MFAEHRRKEDLKTGRIILVDGNIAAGKSTLLQSLNEKLGDQVFPFSEPVELWRAWKAKSGEVYNFLDKSYREKETFSFPFQVFVLATYLEKFREAYKQFLASDKHYFIMERSFITSTTIFGQQLRQENCLTEEEYQILTYLTSQIVAEIPRLAAVDIVFYIKLSPDECYQRLLKRGRSEEDCVPLGYLQDLDKLYESWCAQRFRPFKPKQVVVLDGRQEKAKLKREVDRMLG